MEKLYEQCMLLDEQRSVLLKGISEGKREFVNLVKYIPDTATKTYPPRLLYDLINTKIEDIIKANPHMNLNVVRRKAGFHPYIVIHDEVRNVFILVSKLPKSKHIYNTSRYRGDYAASNFDRLFAMGATEEEIACDVSYQQSIPLGQEHLPFGIIVSYDSESDIVFEGALRPDQGDWIYKKDITHAVIKDTSNIIPLNVYNHSKITLPLKTPKDNDDIIIKLKDK
ncbi:hypothetical protein [Paenibacillus ehimensis]|uniref:Uncharacterized protein n=1 Tax=Paenibacillus ehimensis TaxID=79264 RepID=A0ABT8VEM1_9BACL|nr:hypothetical protein [Paenibacillus ehimensis]MDO3679431.1 hypothetical protein [Paenibacillus ehimensis]MEC0208905.1 hypothetical protein [Paenibacillus ehimensis]